MGGEAGRLASRHRTEEAKGPSGEQGRCSQTEQTPRGGPACWGQGALTGREAEQAERPERRNVALALSEACGRCEERVTRSDLGLERTLWVLRRVEAVGGEGTGL